MKNYLLRTFLLTLLVVLMLAALRYLPPITICGTTLRQVNILSDICPSEEEQAEKDTVVLPVVKPPFVAHCREGVTCIEDFGDSLGTGMLKYYQALDSLQTLDRPVRIAYFGDSFIEGDIFTGDLRALLQKKYGGCGASYVDIFSITDGFRQTVRVSSSGWIAHVFNDTTRFDKSRQGIDERYFIPREGAYVNVSGQSRYATLLDTCQRSTIYFQTSGNIVLTANVNGSESKEFLFAPSEGLQKAEVKGKIGRVRWTVNGETASSVFYGVAMEGNRGISVDCFSMRGRSGATLRSIPQNRLRQYAEQRPYDLIIIHYGLNVASKFGKDYGYYKKAMLKTIAYLQEAFPNSGFLLIGVGDRGYKSESGEIKTMPGVKNLVAYQQQIAAEAHIAFWNLFEAMGGEGSMAELVHSKPSKANYDYTHINFKGGQYLSHFLYDALVEGKYNYDKRKEYERE